MNAGPPVWPSVVPTLTDGSVKLRAWVSGDAEPVFAACQDEDIQRWTRVPVPYLKEHAVGFVGELSRTRWSAGEGAPFAVVSCRDGRVLGSCGLVTVNTAELVGEAGYWVAPWARGQHTAQRALALVTSWAFGRVGLARMELYIDAENGASCAVAEAVGYRREGVLRGKALHRGSRRDMVIYGSVNE